jgi:hypothetical protein
MILYRYYKINSFLKHILQIALMLDPQDSKNFQTLFVKLYHTDFTVLTQYFLEWFHIANNQKIYPSLSSIFLFSFLNIHL